jgi:hypothetical protein
MASKLTTEEVIKRITDIHKDKYDLSKVEYINKRTKIIVICKIHGPWNTNIEQLFRGQGCTICGRNDAAFKRRLSFEYFESKANKIHNLKYIYFKDKYTKSNLKTDILCKEHGVFKMLPSSHIGLQKQGCPKCGQISQKNKRKMSLAEFIKKSNLIHSNKYQYKLVQFENQKDNIKIICIKHGIFEQNVSNHLTGSGCPDCNNSKGENKVKELLLKHNISFVQQKTFKNLKDISLLKCDFYLPKYKCIIEFNGRQHYEIVQKFGGEKGYLENKRRDELKKNYCFENNILYIEIHYKEKNIEHIILNALKTKNIF